MTPLILALIIAAVFAALLAYESESDDGTLRLRPAGLLMWLTTGNWPAKVGAGLMIIGLGALLRYAFANIDVPPEVKLGAGVLAAGTLGFGSMILKDQTKHRAIHLALAGAAFGVAYLTAYSAYGFFNYIADANALALLALVAVAAGVFAVNSNVMSVAILAMIGAYIAPRFALGTPGVLPVYGYYLAVSLLSLIMVTLRGWRPLIHLSFLFTLAGAIFFGWSGRLYEPEYFTSMQPLLLALTAVHLAMPLLERKFARSARILQFDVAYFAALPLVAAALTLKIAPNLHAEGAIGLGALALLWAIAAGILYACKRSESDRHAAVAAVLAILAALFFFRDLPLLLIGLGLSVALIAVARKMGWSQQFETIACGMATFIGVLFIAQSIFERTPSRIFLSELFAYRLTAGALMIFGALAGSRRDTSIAKVLGSIGFGWLLVSLYAETSRLNIDYLPQLGYGILLGALVLYALFADRIPAAASIGGLLVLSLIGLGWVAAPSTSNYVAIAFMAFTPAVLIGLAWAGRDAPQQGGTDFSATIAIGLLPFALLPWAFATADLVGAGTGFYEVTIAMTGIAAGGLAGRYWLSGSARWHERIQPLHVYLTAVVLLWVTLAHIERGIWPVVFDLLALGYLIAYVGRRNREQAPIGPGLGATTILAVAVVLQAMLLRGFGPDDPVMTAFDIDKMHLPAVASLMWVVFGAGLAWRGTTTRNRSLWSAGAGVLVVAAIKLVFFDFGTLGQLGNILAFIVAGMVFMGVAWFAPIPPKAERAPEPRPVPQPAAQPVAPIGPQSLRPEEATAKAAPEVPAKQPLQTATEWGKPSMGMTCQKLQPADPIAARAARPRAGVYRTQVESRTTNRLWPLILGVAIAMSLFYSAQHKRVVLRNEQQRIRAVEAQSAAQAQSPRAPRSVAVPAPAPSAPAAYESGYAPAHTMQDHAVTVAGRLPAQPAAQTDACLRIAASLPSDFAVYAAGAYSGRKIAYQIDQSGHEATQIDVEVKKPGKPIVLMLGAYEPTIWNISVSPDTNVAAVLVGGYHRQAIAGLSESIPSLISTYDNRGPCGHFYVTAGTLAQLNPVARRVFGRSVDTVYPATDGRVVIGAAMSSYERSVTSSGVSPESLRDPSAPLAGQAGLDEAVRKGLLRRATAADAEAWANTVMQNTPQRDISYVAGQGIPKTPKPALYKAYVVLGTFTYPSGLFGADAATFLVPRGVPRPSGNPGHSAVYDFNTLICEGALCGHR